MARVAGVTVEAVIFDWGGTLTPWKTADGQAWRRIAAQLVESDRVDEVAAKLEAADEELWRRSREDHLSGTLAEVFAAAEIADDEYAYSVHDQEWEWATLLDPDAPPLLEGLKERGLRVGVLSNTSWPRVRHEQIFVRDRVDHLIDGAVYTCEIPWTKPHPKAFRAAMAAIGVSEPDRCVFVGDRPFDDIYGASNAGMRTVLLPHSVLPDVQRGHIVGEPDAVINRLGELLPLIDSWI